MTTVIVLFLFATALSLTITPLVRWSAQRMNVMDAPDQRKVHLNPVPRAGGVAIVTAYFITMGLAWLHYGLNPPAPISKIGLDHAGMGYLLSGGLVVFALGLWDDVQGLNPWVKLLFQMAAASLAYYGGIRIETLWLPGMGLVNLTWIAYPATVLWILLMINAVNLIDGLDGLAAGVCFFACIVLLVLSAVGGEYHMILELAALSGAILGFLRYNFNPASIFMGDSGSYFLGYMLATLSIMGSVKSQAAATILIPMMALGVPLMDTIWSTIRRFIFGRGIFRADKNHVHHRLLKYGFTHRMAVLILYGLTVSLGILALTTVYLREERTALVLILLGTLLFFGIRKLGYLNFIDVASLLAWTRDISDNIGITRGRRNFFACQMSVSVSTDIANFWDNLMSVGIFLDVDYIQLTAGQGSEQSRIRCHKAWPEDREPPDPSAGGQRWFYLNLPLNDGTVALGHLVMSVDLKRTSLPPYFFSRVEQLRRTAQDTLVRILLGKAPQDPPLDISCR